MGFNRLRLSLVRREEKEITLAHRKAEPLLEQCRRKAGREVRAGGAKAREG